jgi:hypothetical protein
VDKSEIQKGQELVTRNDQRSQSTISMKSSGESRGNVTVKISATKKCEDSCTWGLLFINEIYLHSPVTNFALVLNVLCVVKYQIKQWSAVN